MSENEKHTDKNKALSSDLTENLTDTKEKFVSRRNALRKAGSMAAGVSLVFLGLGLPGTSIQARPGSGGPHNRGCVCCTNDCMETCAVCTGCEGCTGCTGCRGCKGTAKIVCMGGEDSCDACDGTCAETCGDACSTSCADEAKGTL